MGDLHGLPRSRLAVLPGTTHIGMMLRTDWLVPMLRDFLDADPDAAPPTFQGVAGGQPRHQSRSGATWTT